MTKYVYLFSEGNASMRNLLGGKGANLAEMTNLGLPVPQGFTITTEACTAYYDDGKRINSDISAQMQSASLRKSPERNSVTRRTRFWSPSVQVQEHPCPV